MNYGYTFDEGIRQRIIEASKEAERGDYVAINKLIMEIQKPYIELLDKIRELVV